ncbi:hypothetical protein BH23GEM11_BH23GEM11_08020 [soil metagenome]
MINKNGRTGMRMVWMRRKRAGRRGVVPGPALAAALAVASLAWGAGPLAQPLVGQGLAEFDYENLAPRGIMANIGWVRPGTVNPTGSIGARLDLGYLGPGVRVTTGFSQWSSTLRRSEVAVLEEQLADLVETQTGNRPEVDLGWITWSDVVRNADAHVGWRVPGGLLTYAGAGGTAHVMRGGGASVEGTFIQDLLNTIRAGANLHGGVEVPLGEHLRVVGEGRIELVQSVTYAQVRAGLQYTWGPAAPGERR